MQLASLQAEDSIPSITASQNVRAPSSMQRQLQAAISLPSDLPQPADGNAVSNGEAAPTEQNLQNDVLLESVTSPVVRASAQVAAEKLPPQISFQSLLSLFQHQVRLKISTTHRHT